MQIKVCFQASQSYLFPKLWNKVKLVHWRHLPEGYLCHIHSLSKPCPHFCVLLPCEPMHQRSGGRSRATRKHEIHISNEQWCKKSSTKCKPNNTYQTNYIPQHVRLITDEKGRPDIRKSMQFFTSTGDQHVIFNKRCKASVWQRPILFLPWFTFYIKSCRKINMDDLGIWVIPEPPSQYCLVVVFLFFPHLYPCKKCFLLRPVLNTRAVKLRLGYLLSSEL